MGCLLRVLWWIFVGVLAFCVIGGIVCSITGEAELARTCWIVSAVMFGLVLIGAFIKNKFD